MKSFVVMFFAASLLITAAPSFASTGSPASPTNTPSLVKSAKATKKMKRHAKVASLKTQAVAKTGSAN